MARPDYPLDLRVDYPGRSSRGWAALTITLLKFLALLPHGVALVFLGLAQMVVAFVAQVAVALRGEYPPGMFAFVTGVLRWYTRVSAFLYSLTDRYPPFTLQPDDTYAVDVAVERPAQQNRVYAAFTALVQVLLVAAIVWVVVWVARGGSLEAVSTSGPGSSRADGGSVVANLNPQSWLSGGLLLRQIAAVPHFIVLIALGIVSFVIWLVVQWVILFTAVYPRGMFDLVAGILRWQTRVNGYAFGLSDRYPPFSLEASAAAAEAQLPPAPAAQLPPAQWYPDPLGRHVYRYWDGTQWTPHVADAGGTGYDPLDDWGSTGQA
jgi:hypothetical protein